MPLAWILFDWGGTLMSEDGPADRPMALLPEVRAIDGAADVVAALAARHRIAVATNATVSDRRSIRDALTRVGLEAFVSATTSRTTCWRRAARASRPSGSTRRDRPRRQASSFRRFTGSISYRGSLPPTSPEARRKARRQKFAYPSFRTATTSASWCCGGTGRRLKREGSTGYGALKKAATSRWKSWCPFCKCIMCPALGTTTYFL